MATSGSYDFTITGDNIVNDAYFDIGIGQEGEAMTGDLLIRGRRLLNMLVQQLVGSADGAPSLKMWTREHATLFVQKNQYKYTLGPASTDDLACPDSEYTSTTLSSVASATDTTLTVTSITGAADGDYLIVLLDSGSWHQTTINGTPSGSTITITDQMPSAAASGKTVRFFTNKVQKPDKILYMLRQTSDGDDQPLDPITLPQYMSLPDKDATGSVTCYYEENRLSNTDVYFDVAVDDATDMVKFVYLKPIQDFDATNDNPDFPKVWYRALKNQLAIDLCPGQGQEATQTMKENAVQSLAIARNHIPEKTVLYFEPGKD